MSIEYSFNRMNSRQIRKDKIRDFLTGVGNVFQNRIIQILGMVGFAVIASVQPVNSQDDSVNVSRLDFSPFYLNNFSKPDVQGILSETGFVIQDKERFQKFVELFFPVLQELDKFGCLTSGDMNDAMNLYDAWEKRDLYPVPYRESLIFFLSNYPNPEIQVREKLAKIGISE